MNALWDPTRLPVGMLPVTLEYEANALPVHVPVERIGDYITEAGNPRNERHARFARVQLPSPFLRRGFHFVDRPGIGSTIAETARTTLGFLSEADALLLVTNYAHDMRRYVVHLDGSDPVAAAERPADQRGLAIRAGSRALNGLTRSW